MQSRRVSDILYTAQDGYISCPTCGKKLQRITRETEAENLPIWCPRCRMETIITIHRDRSA